MTVSEKCRMLFWPSDIDDGVAIVGWRDETPSSISMIPIGSLPMSSMLHPAEKDGASGSARTEEHEKDASDATVYAESIASAIDILAQRYPCSRSDNSRDGCGTCHNCATYRTLQVLEVVNNPIRTHNISGKGGVNRSDIEKIEWSQIILYDRIDAETWHDRHFNPIDTKCHTCYPDGTWQRSALRMGKAACIFEQLMWTISNNMLRDREGGEAAKMPDRAASPTKASNNLCGTSMLHKSLLLAHLGLGGQQQQHKISVTTRITERISIFSVVEQLIQTKSAFRMKARTRTSFSRRGSQYLTSRLIGLVLDCILGILIGYALMKHPLPILQRLAEHWEHYHNRKWAEWLHWLESFPADIKLNVPLTKKFGNEIQMATSYHESIVSYIFMANTCISTEAVIPETCNIASQTMPATLLRCFGLLTIVFGSRFFFALASDVTWIAFLHIHLLSYLFATCHRLELSTLTSLFLLFRGKKRNVLRKRSDHLKFDHMQLLLGMILFTICLFMFTTVLVYHFFFTIVDIVAICVRGIWRCGYMSIEAIMNCDMIALENSRHQSKMERSWAGQGMQFHPVTISDDINDSSLSPHVSPIHDKATTMKAIFPTKSSSGIIAKALFAYVLSKLNHVATFMRTLIFGIRYTKDQP